MAQAVVDLDRRRHHRPARAAPRPAARAVAQVSPGSCGDPPDPPAGRASRHRRPRRTRVGVGVQQISWPHQAHSSAIGYGNLTPTPPSTTSVWPLMYADRSLTRNSSAAGDVRGLARRGAAGRWRRCAGLALLAEVGSTPAGSRRRPGRRRWYARPPGPSSTAAERTSDISPALAAPYAACRGAAVMPDTDATKTKVPPPSRPCSRPKSWVSSCAWRSTMSKVPVPLVVVDIDESRRTATCR